MKFLVSLKKLVGRTKWRGRTDDPRLPSLVRAMQAIVPRSVMKHILDTSNDRRQWGVLGAAWIGVSEREFTRAVARELGLEHRERIPDIDLQLLGEQARAHLDNFRRCGVVPVAHSGSINEFVAVDPAEVRGVPLFDGSQEISIGSWSDVCASIDKAERVLAESEAQAAKEETNRKAALCRQVLSVIVDEAHAHRATCVEILSIDGRARYQFLTPDGRRGYGNIHRGVMHDLFTHAALIDGNVLDLPNVGQVLIRSLGSAATFKLSWEVPHILTLPPPGEPLPPNVSNEEVVPDPASVLPQNLSRSDISPDSVSTVRDGDAFSRSGSIEVLVVDDNPMFCRVVERLLGRDGFTTLFAENGALALERLLAKQGELPAVIICDLHMPIMNGKEFVSHIRTEKRFAGIPIIMLTSDEDVEVELSLLGNGADAFLSKSRDPRILCAHVRRLAHSSVVREAA